MNDYIDSQCKRTLLVASGGIDSTAIMLMNYSDNVSFDVVYVKIKNNKSQCNRELKALRKMIMRLNDMFYMNNHLPQLKTIDLFDEVDDKPFIMHLMFVVSVAYELDVDLYDNVQFGYIIDDVFWHKRDKLEQVFLSTIGTFDVDNVSSITIQYPLEYYNKKTVIDLYENFPEIFEMIECCCRTSKCTDSNDLCEKCNERSEALKSKGNIK